jgi:hypothetical protein
LLGVAGGLLVKTQERTNGGHLAMTAVAHQKSLKSAMIAANAHTKASS